MNSRTNSCDNLWAKSQQKKKSVGEILEIHVRILKIEEIRARVWIKKEIRVQIWTN